MPIPAKELGGSLELSRDLREYGQGRKALGQVKNRETQVGKISCAASSSLFSVWGCSWCEIPEKGPGKPLRAGICP